MMLLILFSELSTAEIRSLELNIHVCYAISFLLKKLGEFVLEVDLISFDA